MKIKTKFSDKVTDAVIILITLLMILIMLYPMLNVVATSFSSNDMITGGKVTWYPKGFNINGYRLMMKDADFLVAYKNTIIYVVVGTLIMLIGTSMLSYTLSINDFVLRKGISVFVLITMFLSGGIIPTYIMYQKLGIFDTIWAMVLPGAISAYNVFVFRSFFCGIPKELRESASIDGANDFTIWLKIIMPLSKPVIATYGLFKIVEIWNSWFNASMYLSDTSKYPLQMLLRKIVVMGQLNEAQFGDDAVSEMMRSLNINPQNAQMAAVVIAMVPILCIYPFIQKYFAKGVMIGAVKG